MSNLIKSSFYVASDDRKVIESPPIILHTDDVIEDFVIVDEVDSEEMLQNVQMRDQIIHDAEIYAEDLIRQSLEAAGEIKLQATNEIEHWWQERRLQDQQLIEEKRLEGLQLGYLDAKEQAELAVEEEYKNIIIEAQNILQQAHRMKLQIINEAEPFLVELSGSIALKIIGQQLTLTPEVIIEMTKKVLLRKQERGVITLCVSPSQFSIIAEAREELSLVIDSQAELQVIPDASIIDQGCVIRSSFGSVDARIDTQLSGIKQALLQLAWRNEGSVDDVEYAESG